MKAQSVVDDNAAMNGAKQCRKHPTELERIMIDEAPAVLFGRWCLTSKTGLCGSQQHAPSRLVCSASRLRRIKATQNFPGLGQAVLIFGKYV